MNRNKHNRGRGSRKNFIPQVIVRKSKYYTLQDKLEESDVGITEFINKDLKGFSGIIKARFSDFQVNEIDLHDNVAKLTNTDIPEVFREKKLDRTDPPTESPIEQISNETWTSIVQLKNKTESDEVISMLAIDKEDRTLIHTTVKRIFGQHLVSNTVKKEDQQYVELRKASKDKPQDNRSPWPVDGEYVHFLLYKEHTDTIQAAMKIAQALRMKTSCFTYAGVKDRRAKSTQWFCVRKVHPAKILIRVNKVHRNMKIGNFKFEDAPLRLGDLNGNVFRIALRNVTADDAGINVSLEKVKNNGFINYYGLQRFGVDKHVPTHLIGIKLLQGNFKDACELILKVKNYDDPNDGITKAKKKYLESKDAKAALLYCDINDNNSIESKLLEGLAKCSANDYVTALESIARNMRLFYIHAFQSLIWNNATSKRIRDFGLKPVIGDLVLIAEKTKIVEPEEEELDDEELSKVQEVETVTAENISKYTIYDVVLPLPGYDVIYPEHLKDYYQELLSEHGLSKEMPKQRVATYTLSGNYRCILQRATNMTWKTLRYNDQNDTLIRSDFEEILKHEEPVSKPDGEHKAVVVTFHLPSASYATMCLREAMKIDTSTATHAMMLENINGKDKEQTKEELPQENSLLADKDKFEAFKRSIFGSASEGDTEGVKRKLLDEEDLEKEDSKKLKGADEEEKTVITMQASMP